METSPAEIVQMEVAVESIVNVTAFPDAPPAAVGVYEEPYAALVGAVDVKVIACAILATETVPALVTEDETPPLVTVIVTEITVPISAAVKVYVEFVAFVIAVPARRH
jgi:hypothetical protein